ncbi:hypothetical protein B7463_g4955, partial [Scytalidium lignicola]
MVGLIAAFCSESSTSMSKGGGMSTKVYSSAPQPLPGWAIHSASIRSATGFKAVPPGTCFPTAVGGRGMATSVPSSGCGPS